MFLAPSSLTILLSDKASAAHWQWKLYINLKALRWWTHMMNHTRLSQKITRWASIDMKKWVVSDRSCAQHAVAIVHTHLQQWPAKFVQVQQHQTLYNTYQCYARCSFCWRGFHAVHQASKTGTLTFKSASKTDRKKKLPRKILCWFFCVSKSLLKKVYNMTQLVVLQFQAQMSYLTRIASTLINVGLISLLLLLLLCTWCLVLCWHITIKAFLNLTLESRLNTVLSHDTCKIWKSFCPHKRSD